MTQSKKKILILGGAGFLGANLVRRLLQEPDFEITVVDSLDPRFLSTEENLKKVREKIEFIKGNILDEALLKKIIPGKDVIFQLAAQSSHPYSLEHPIEDAEINCLGNLRVLEALKAYNPQARIVFSSSSTAVGRAVGDVIDEAHGEKPLDIYSANKSVAEKYYRIYHRVYDIPTVVLRFANLYGPFGKFDPAFGFVNYFIHLAKSGKPIQIYGEGDQTRNVMFAEDAADILWLAASHPKLLGETFFAASQEHHSVKEIAQAIVEVFDQGRIEQIPWPDVRKRIEIEKVIISSAKLHYLTGWKPKYSLRQGLELTKQRMEGNF
ncbi:MAG: GDP-mannose 4,6-dehydratase [Patescibacteria group bacterium]|nr:GDP-mannose 4,6-dehydratase [Patescibacteria group bacterium]